MSAALVLAIAAVYGQALAFDFQDFYDDVEYVSKNPFVSGGLSRESVAWAFTTFQVGNWHPLTSLSHMLDCELFGLDAGWHHLTNVVLHALNSVLLLWLLWRTSGALWRSAAVAALFALHPLHVESVAWISERKDVLSTLFGLLAIAAHVRYARSPSFWRAAVVALALALGLMAKPMLVTLPLVLLLVDFWPLGRLRGASNRRELFRTLRPLVLEKAPLFALAAAASAVAFVAQWRSGAVSTLEKLSLGERVGNSLVAYADYLRDALWPTGLCAFYPRVEHSGWRVAGSLLVLVLVSAAALRARRRIPSALMGWLWYLVTLVPVIGLVQVGEQARADRYTYLPLVGIGVMVAWGLAELALVRRHPRVTAAAVSAVLLALSIASWQQVRTWRDSVTLFERALAVTEDNWFAHYDLAGALTLRGRFAQARPHFFEAARLNPSYAPAQVGVGYALEQDGELDQAIVHYREAVRLAPAMVEGHIKLGTALLGRGELGEAAQHLAEAVRLAPTSAAAHHGLGLARRRLGRIAEAAEHFAQALRIRPDWAEAHDDLGLVLLEQGEPARALEHFAEAVRLKPDFAAARAHADEARRDLAARADEP